MDIVLNTSFNNPNLPVVTLPGFTDSFDRPASSSLGSTDDGKPWENWGYGDWSVTSRGTALGVGGGLHASVDGLASDGTLTAVVASAATAEADKRSGLLFRMLDRENYAYVCPNTSNVLTLYVRVGGATVLSRSISGETLATGDTLAVEMFGPQVTVLRNGVAVLSETVSELVGETHHGLYGSSAADTEWDSIEFTPA